MVVVLIFLSFDSINKITVGTKRVPDYTVINKRIDYQFDTERNFQIPVISDEDVPLFG